MKNLTSILLLSFGCPFSRKCTGKKAAKKANHPIASVKDLIRQQKQSGDDNSMFDKRKKQSRKNCR
jgi:hypothetical protein